MDYGPVAPRAAPRFGAPAAIAYACGAVPLLAAFVAGPWPLELASHFVVLALLGASAVALSCALRRRWLETATGASLALGYSLLCAPLYVAPARDAAPRATLKVVSANLLYRSSDTRPITTWLAAQQPDVMVLMELTPRWRAALDPVLVRYPHQLQYLREDAFGIGVYSRLPLRATNVSPDDLPMIEARIAHGDRTVTLYAVHSVPPVNRYAAAVRDLELRHVAQLARKARRDVIVAGDLNTTSWSPIFGALLDASKLVDTRRGFGVQGSWPAAWPAPLRIPIDHIITSPDVATLHREVAPDTGSDHRAIMAELGLR